MTVARRRLIGTYRHEGVRTRAATALRQTFDDINEMTHELQFFPDERLKLMFICAHPAIDPSVRAPLMLQTVLGLDAACIARAFLVTPSAMGQRLVRAKNKIRSSRPGFEIPHSTQLPSRLDAVLDAIYVAYGTGWEDISGGDGLAREAVELGSLLQWLLPGHPEVLGLLALMLFCESRRMARRDARGTYVPLSSQATSEWSVELIERADELLREAAVEAQAGRFQLEAAIQSVHADRIRTGETNWPGIIRLYDLLIRLSPSLGARVARIAAVAEVHGAPAAWAELQELESPSDVAAFQPYWALAAHLLNQMGRSTHANEALSKAIRLSADSAARDYLLSLQNRATQAS